MSDSTPAPATAAAFATTRWTIVLGAQDVDRPRARQALEELCRAYWRPIYAYLRRLGRSPADAQDLTQGFFEGLLAARSLERVHPSRGRFRSFLLASLKHFLANEQDRVRTLKRGGHLRFVPLEPGDDSALWITPADPSAPSPDRAFDRQWALALLDRVLDRLRDEHAASGKSIQFEALRATLTAPRDALPYSEISARLGLTEGAVKVAVHRLRQRYRAVLREEIAGTLDDPARVEEELRHLFAALAS